MRDRERKTAEKFNIVDMVEKLESELLTIDGVTEVDFDLDGFYDHMNQVILLTKYDIPADTEEYFEKRKALKNQVIEIAGGNFLTKTEDRIEDYGEHFYFVFHCFKEWGRK